MSVQNPNIEKWNRWLDVICKDLVDLHYYRTIYKEVCSMVDANSAIQKPSSFYVLLASGYVTLVFIIIRRQVSGVKFSDKGDTCRLTRDKDSISLAGLLFDISTHTEEVSRQRFHRLYAGLGRSEARIDSEFEAAGVDAGRDFVDPDMVTSDLTALMRATRSLHKYTDKTIAHIDTRRWTGTIPTFGDLDDAIDTLSSVCGKYSKLVRTGDYCFEPIIPPTWKVVFRVPWIMAEPSEHETQNAPKRDTGSTSQMRDQP